MAAGDIEGGGLICKHPSRALKKAAARFKAGVVVGTSAALEMDALVPSFIFLMFASHMTNHLEKVPGTKQKLFSLSLT